MGDHTLQQPSTLFQLRTSPRLRDRNSLEQTFLLNRRGLFLYIYRTLLNSHVFGSGEDSPVPVQGYIAPDDKLNTERRDISIQNVVW